MRKVLTLVTVAMLCLSIAAPVFAAAPSASAPVASVNKTAALPVVINGESTLVSANNTNALSKESKETFKAAQTALKAAAPAGMQTKYFFYNLTSKAGNLTLNIGNVKSVVVKQFKDGKWVELECTINADGTVTIPDLGDGPVAVFAD